jgi:hypothetical protein
MGAVAYGREFRAGALWPRYFFFWGWGAGAFTRRSLGGKNGVRIYCLL